MTLIQPNKKITALPPLFIAALVIPIILGVIWLILLYNTTVDLRHRFTTTKSAIQTIGTENSQMKDQVFSLLDKAHLEALAKERGLKEDRNPQFVTLDTQWEFASHY